MESVQKTYWDNEKSISLLKFARPFDQTSPSLWERPLWMTPLQHLKIVKAITDIIITSQRNSDDITWVNDCKRSKVVFFQIVHHKRNRSEKLLWTGIKPQPLQQLGHVLNASSWSVRAETKSDASLP